MSSYHLGNEAVSLHTSNVGLSEPVFELILTAVRTKSTEFSPLVWISNSKLLPRM